MDSTTICIASILCWGVFVGVIQWTNGQAIRTFFGYVFLNLFVHTDWAEVTADWSDSRYAHGGKED